MQTALANAQWLAKHGATKAEREAAARHADAILALAATLLDSPHGRSADEYTAEYRNRSDATSDGII